MARGFLYISYVLEVLDMLFCWFQHFTAFGAGCSNDVETSDPSATKPGGFARSFSEPGPGDGGSAEL